MNTTKSTIVFLLISLWFVPNLSAQKQTTADKIYDRLGYKTSIPKYKEGDVLSLEEITKIANSYRLNHDTYNAESWYAQAVDISTSPIDFLHYAEALQSNGKYQKAREYYLKYDEMLGGNHQDRRGELLANAIDRMNEFKHSNIEVKNEELLNTEKLDFSPSYYNDGVVYVSTRKNTLNDDSKDIWIDDNFMALYNSKIQEDGTLVEPEIFSINLTTKFHEGPVSFNRRGDQIFFTRNDYIKRRRRNNSKGIMKLQIYTATKDGDDWGFPEELPFNTREYEEAHPAISPDGKMLFFTSDRDGGYGGMDLYVSHRRNGTWTAPSNLGPEINTAGNELFPFVHDDGMLYFASNGWGGLGGLDIFSSRMNTEKEWMTAENIGTPYNSPMDDFGLIMNILKTEGYFTSAREEGHGQDDIYSFKINGAQKLPSVICAYEDGTDLRLSDVEVIIMEKNLYNKVSEDEDYTLKLIETDIKDEYLLKFRKEGMNGGDAKEDLVYTTNENGEFTVDLYPDREYMLIAKKGGYIVAEQALSTMGKTTIEMCIPLEPMECLVLEGIVKNKKYGNTIPSADVTMVNLCTGDTEMVLSGSNGEFSFPCIPCECEYTFWGEKAHFTSGEAKANTLAENCKPGETIEVLLELNPGERTEKVVLPTTVNPPTYNPPPPPPTRVPNYWAGTELTEGAVIEVPNIYYDFDQYYIRGDAARELDKVVSLLYRFPTMTIELGSHTDARGRDAYNEKLSANRADAAVKYIVSKGIDSRRLIARGYGETTLRNRCANFADCSEEEHQYNRRTEIKILRFNNHNIGVKYINNAPEKIDEADPTRNYVWD